MGFGRRRGGGGSEGARGGARSVCSRCSSTEERNFARGKSQELVVLVAAGWCWVEGAWWSCHRANCEGPARSAQWQLRSACWLVHHLGEKGVGISPGDVCSIKNLETGGP